MYIAPNSIIKLCNNVPIDNTYRNTLWFDNETAQLAYFNGKAKYTFNAQSYQRANRGALKVSIAVENIYDCNYLMFQNTSFGNKWFYGFITNIEYISNDVSRVEYELDVMQTWFFDYTLGTNFVEREHSVTDGVGDNLIEENLEIGELKCNGAVTIDTYTNRQYNPVVAATFNATWDSNEGAWVFDRSGGGAQYNACYSGLFLINLVNDARANLFIQQVTSEVLEDSIVAFFMYPADFIASPGGAVIYYDNAVSIARPAMDGSYPSIDGYTPKNHKLYTYPYSQLLVTDGGAQSVSLRYENFNAVNCSFRIVGETAVNPTIALIPYNYLGMSGYDPHNAILMTGFPMCAYSTDLFKAFIAQTYGPAIGKLTPAHTETATQIASIGSTVGGIGSAVTDVAGTIFGANEAAYSPQLSAASHINKWSLANHKSATSMIGSAINAANEVFDSLHAYSNTFLQGFQAHGNQSDTCLTNFGYKGFHFYPMTLKYDYARSVDSFFTMFGYATKCVKTPNRTSRPHWNYVQLKNTHIEGGIPFDHETVICAIYDRGITFWKNPAEVGDYSLDNRPT